MKVLHRLGFLVLASGMALAQSNPPSDSTVANELKALREAIAAQQKQIAQQQQDMVQQRQQIETLKQTLEDKTSGTPHIADAALRTPTTDTEPVTVATALQSDASKPNESPLSFRIGGAEFTPGGFVDFENVFRTTNSGSSITTPFGTIPFSNTVQGHLTEFRSTGQYSRLNLKVATKYGENRITGYVEGDFNGNDAANVFVTSNPHTARVRLYWLDLKRGNWEFLGGQTWGLQTPNRVGLSPMPSDVFTTLGEDAQTHVGLPYTRAGEFRVVYHFSDRFQWGVAMQNPDQFVGAGETIFPFAFNAALGPQLDAANQTTSPNAFPDIHTKFAWDSDAGGKHFHFEGGGILTTVKLTNVPVGGTQFVSHTAIGGGILAAFNVELVKNFRVLANGIWGPGVGRYLIGLAPQTVVVPIQTGPTSFDLDASMVHSGSAIVGVEMQPHPKTQLGVYYGGMYAQRNAFPDSTSPLVVKPIIGFGGTNSPNSANRSIQEATFDWTQTFWKHPQYGAVLLVTQTSYVTRSPWFVATGAPKNAHLMMGYVSVRYVLP